MATVAAVAVSALGAGSALAAPATFNDLDAGAQNPLPDALVWGIEGTVKLALGNPANPSTEARCTSAHLTQPMPTKSTSNSGSPLQGSASGLTLHAYCPMGWPQYMGVVYLSIPGPLTAETNGGTYTLTASSAALASVVSNSIYGPYWQSDPSHSIGSYSGAWTNGTSVANPSRLAFTATTVAKRYGTTEPVTLTGTFTARNPGNANGQLVTLN